MTVHTLDLKFLNQDETIAAFLLDTNEGPVLIETGPYSTFPQLEQALSEHGWSTSDVRHVFLTHIHFDHAGAAWALAESGATIYVHPAGAPHLSDPSKLVNSASRIYGDDMERLWSTIRPINPDHIHETADGETIQVGNLHVKSWHTPGHASHHIAWQVGAALFAGDVAGVKIGEGPVVPPCPPPDINIELWKQSIEVIRNIEGLKQIYLTHFGPVTALKPHLDQLEIQLNNWSGWILEQFKDGKTAKEVTPLFMEYAASQLRTFGLNDAQILQYEYANPAWMSVAGLMRYWKKKLAP